MQCVILAGGLGTRMSHISSSVPKALLPVAGRPFAWHQLHLLARVGVTDVVYCIGHLGNQIRDFWHRTPAPISSMRFVDEGEELQGTGGALRLALEQGVLKQSFFVLYGDSYLPISFARVWTAFQSSRASVLMTVLRNSGRWDRSNVRFTDGRVELYDKHADAGRAGMEHIDYGLTVMTREIVRSLRMPSDLATLYHELSVKGKLAGFEVRERFYEVGSPEGLSDLERYLKNAESN